MIAAAVALLLAGCGFLTQASVSSASCANIAGGVCTEQIERMQARHPGATSIDLECSAPVCDRTGGRGTVVVTMPDGTRLNDTFAYVGDPNPMPAPVCTGMPPDACRNAAIEQADNVPPSKRIVGVRVDCTAPACTATDGSARVTVALADGSTEQHDTSWSTGAP